MPELRWILLGLGVLFCLGLWWWEARRGRQAADSNVSLNPTEGFTSTSTTVVRDVGDRLEEPGPIARELPPWNVSFDEEPTGDELEEQSEAEPLDEAQFEVPPPEQFSPQPVGDIAAAPRPSRERIEPTIGDAAAAVGAAQEVAAQQQGPERIVTLRVAAPPLERFEGRRLVAALRAAGLEHGKFSIFHKAAPDGTTLFSVASLVEPGTFDLDAVDGRRFPGVSIFVVLRPGSGQAAFDDMLGTARGLAASLQGTVQDERGAPMSPQKLADLRVDVLTWQRTASGS